LFLSNHELRVYVVFQLPANRLPPVRGMMLIEAPPVSDSPSPPES
jgi:hypothetical protein